MTDRERARSLEHLMKAEDSLKVFPQRFREAIDDAEICKETLYTDVFCCREASSAYSNGVRIPNGRSLLYICNYLNVSADWLLGFTDEKRKIW